MFSVDTVASPLLSLLFEQQFSHLLWGIFGLLVLVPLAPFIALLATLSISIGIYAIQWLRGRNRLVVNWWEETVLVTGGSTGIGKDLVIRLVRKHRARKVVVIDVKEPDWKDERLLFVKCDISDHRAVKECIDSINKTVGVPTVLVNNAGIVVGKKLTELSPEEITKTIHVNLLGLIFTTKYVLTGMLNAKRGHIINISSVLGIAGAAHVTDYSASKFGVFGFNDALRQELAGTHIKTSVICPGLVNSGMFDGVIYKFPFLIPPLETGQVVDAVIHCIEQDRSMDYRMPFMSSLVGSILHSLPLEVSDFARELLGANDSMKSFRK